jgi:hypothetical protein
MAELEALPTDTCSAGECVTGLLARTRKAVAEYAPGGDDAG